METGLPSASAGVVESPPVTEAISTPETTRVLSPENQARAQKVAQMQEGLRKQNEREKVGHRMFIEIPLGGNADSVVQIFRPDVVPMILNPNDSESEKLYSEIFKETSVGGYTKEEIKGNIKGRVDAIRQKGMIAAVLPEIGPVWIQTGGQLNESGPSLPLINELQRLFTEQGAGVLRFDERARYKICYTYRNGEG